MKYKRLTKRREMPLVTSMWDSMRIYKRLLELENKIESGQLVELPYAPDRIEVAETRIVRSEFDDSVEFQTLIYIAMKKDNLEEAMDMLEELEQNATQIDDNSGAIMFRLHTRRKDLFVNDIDDLVEKN